MDQEKIRKQFQQAAARTLLDNSGNKLTAVLIAGLVGTLDDILKVALSDAAPVKTEQDNG